MKIVLDSFHSKFPLTDQQIKTTNCKPFDYEEMKAELLKGIDWFNEAPFTIQRLCELLCYPEKHYARTDKFMRGIEKNILVVSTLEPPENKYNPPKKYVQCQ